MPDEVTELPNLPDVTAMEFIVNGERFAMDQGTLQSYLRTLDLHTGEATRTVQWKSPAGAALELTFRRFVSLDNEHIAAFSVEVTPTNQDIELVVNSGISTRNSNTGSQHCVEGENADAARWHPAPDDPYEREQCADQCTLPAQIQRRTLRVAAGH